MATGTVYAATSFASEVSFTSKKGLVSTNVQDAIDEIYEKNSYYPKYAFSTSLSENIFENSDIVLNSDYMNLVNQGKKIFLARYAENSYGVCLYLKGSLSCFKTNNYDVEKEHVKQVFGESNCFERYNDNNVIYSSCTINDNITVLVRGNGRVYGSVESTDCTADLTSGSINCLE